MTNSLFALRVPSPLVPIYIGMTEETAAVQSFRHTDAGRLIRHPDENQDLSSAATIVVKPVRQIDRASPPPSNHVAQPLELRS